MTHRPQPPTLFDSRAKYISEIHIVLTEKRVCKIQRLTLLNLPELLGDDVVTSFIRRSTADMEANRHEDPCYF